MEIDSSNAVKYTLRTKSLMKRIESEKSRQGGKKREPKEKQKPPPLSKYRRKTANARERNRMKEINEAFETLQKTLPDLPGVDAEKLTKITVLRLAVNYIKILSCVKDGDFIGTKNIDDLRNLWCVSNAHMARPEHCVRPIFKSNKISTNQNKTLKLISQKQKPVKNKQINSIKPTDATKEKQPLVKKKSCKSRTRGKVCKTASVATSNGAYITLKNVAFQCTPNRKGHLDNKPLMMSMTVKRPRLEHIGFKRPPKISRYDPPKPITKLEKPATPFINTINCNTISLPYSENLSPLLGSLQFDFVHSESTLPVNDKYLTSFAIYDLDIPVIKNDVVLEYPNRNRHSHSASVESDLFSEKSTHIFLNQKSPSNFSFIPNGEFSPNSSRTTNAESPTHSSDTDNILAPSLELENILGSEPFQEELDHLASSLVEADEALNIFLDHHSSNFIATNINTYS